MKLKLYSTLHEGESLQFGYFPVAQPAERYGYELWIFPLAPFVWIFRLVLMISYNVWWDMQKLIHWLSKSAQAKKG